MRLSIAAAVVCFSIIGVAAADHAAASIRKFTNIPAQGLGSALQTFARERDLQLVYLSDAVDKLKTSGAFGDFTADEALKRLLRGTGLAFHYLDEKTITVGPASGAGPSVPTTADQTRSTDDTGDRTPSETDQSQGNTPTKAFRDRLLLAQATQGPSPASGSVAQRNQERSEQSVQLEEVVVTAQKKSENLINVPVPVTALSAGTLTDNGDVLITEYANEVPGLSVSPSPGTGQQQQIQIRGLATGYNTNPTVGITVDDVPFGSSISYLGNVIPDVDPSNLAQVEVLRGPQGTLYGASSMGGLLKFVTNDPSTSETSGRVQAGVSGLYNGAEPGYNVNGAINMPLTDTLAVRASAFTRLLLPSKACIPPSKFRTRACRRLNQLGRRS